MIRPSAGGRAGLLAAGISLVLLTAGQTAAAGGTTAPAVPDTFTGAAGTSATVTLVTGDRVTVTELGGGRKTVTVDRAEGAIGAVRSEISDGRITVVPDEARPYLASGVLDRRLFDVSGLIAQGVTDELPLIVTHARGARAAAPRGTETVRALPSIGGAAVEATDPAAFWRSFTSPATRSAGFKVWLDGKVEAAMAESNAQIGTPKAWEAGLTGKGVKVAVLDTGADLGHPDLAGRVAESKSFIEGQEVADRDGHGTHVASTVGGSGAGSDGLEKGVAPGATLAVGKVLSDEGSGTESQIIAGMEWAAKDIDATIVSMSLGSSEASDGTDPMAQAVNTLSAETGALFVIAAGNSGAPGSIGSPGAADSALTVGAVDAADQAAYFTSQGPRFGDQALKPDLSAPGVDILAARSRLAPGSGLYTTMSGTSMATPHVAGVAALLAEKHPDWTGAQLKNALMSTSKTLTDSAYALGAGRVDVAAAIAANVTATGSADLGFFAWPYEENKPVTKTVTYTNHSASAVELNLAVEGMPEGVATLADTTLTVPAHGTAQTTVTGDGAKAPVGNASGRIVASAAGTPVAHTALGLVKEEERYTLTIRVKDRDGAPAPATVIVKQLAEGRYDPFPVAVGDSGTVQLRLKPDTYTVDTFLDVRGSGGKDSLGLGFLTDPEIVLDRDREITLDGRQLREIRAEVQQRTETRQLLMEFDRDAHGASYGGAVQVPPAYDSIFAAPTRKPAHGTFEYRTVWRLGKPLLEASADGDRLSDATVQAGTTLLEGRHRLDVVDAGTGTAAEYAGRNVKGKAVLVRAGAVPNTELAQNAQDAGATALFVTDDRPGRLMSWFGTAAYEDRPLAVATVNAADAAKLAQAAKRGKRIDLTGTRYTPYTYDLSEGHRGAIGTDLVFRPGRNELATIRSAFHMPTGKKELGGEFRYSITDAFPVGFGFKERIAFPVERTEYVSTGTGQGWHESVDLADSLEQRGGVNSYRGGTTRSLDWFEPVWHPWLGTGLGWGQERVGNDLRFNTPGWGDSGPDHTGFGNVWGDDSMTQFTEVYVDGTRVDRKMSSGAYAWDAPAEEATYKVVTDTTMDPARWRLSTKGHAEWTFRSKETPSDRVTHLPLINLGFDVDTDLKGDVRGGSKVPVGIHAEYVKGAAGTGRIGGGTLEVSYDDGGTWQKVWLRKSWSEADWTGELRVPHGARFVSFRAGASDDRGGSVTQEIIRAVGVK